MKKLAIPIAELLLFIAYVLISTDGFSQDNLPNSNWKNNSSAIKFEFLGEDLMSQFPPFNKLNLLPEKKVEENLKESLINPPKLDSILEMKNFGFDIERKKWNFNYDSNNQLLSSNCLYFNNYYAYLKVKEMRDYNEKGQVVKMVKNEYCFYNQSYFDPLFSLIDSTMDSYIEQNKYENGNLVNQQIKEYDIHGLFWYYSTSNSVYNVKNQLTQKITNGDNGHYKQTIKLQYIYDRAGRINYFIDTYVVNANETQDLIHKYDYQITDTTMVIQEKTVYTANLKDLNNLENLPNWNDELNYQIKFDLFGRVKSFVSSLYNWYDKVIWMGFKVEYEYTTSNQLKHAAYFMPNDRIDFKSWVETSKIDNTYDAEDHLLEYKKTFYDSRISGWATEESKNYHYHSTKSAPIDDQNITMSPSIYPNPSTDYIRFSVSPDENSSYLIYNLLGETVDKGNFNNQPISISMLKSGIYFIKFEINGRSSVNRFFKK